MKRFLVLGMVLVAGCSTVEQGSYRPKSGNEKKVHGRADRSVRPADVTADFKAFENTEVAWAGIITEVQFKETERTIQVAFKVEHRDFDWKDHGGGKPYHLSATGDGLFLAGWAVNKPARIDYLRSRAKPGYMIVVHGKPYQTRAGLVQLSATAVRPIKTSDFELLAEAPAD